MARVRWVLRLCDAEGTAGLCCLSDRRQGQHGAEAAAGLTGESGPPVRSHPERRHSLTPGLPGAGLTQATDGDADARGPS